MLLIDKSFGVLVIEVKDCQIDNIKGIEGYFWYMQDWHLQVEKPFQQVKDKHMYQLKKRIERSSEGGLISEGGDLIVSFNYLVCLPFISEEDWLERFGTSHDHAKIIFKDAINPESIKEKIKLLPFRKTPLSDDSFEQVLRVVTCSTALTRNPGAPIADTSSRGFYLRECRKSTCLLDDRQVDVAYSIPPSPQRIRGLAGSGKTVVLAAKIAYMHSKNPDWKIL